MNKALIIIDLQNDFCPGGALAVNNGDKIVPIINKITPIFEKVIATQDWHPQNHISFASNHSGKKVLDTIDWKGESQILWPDHCVNGEPGAAFHPDLDIRPIHLIIRKGTNPELDSYSAFLENDKKTETGLDYYLKGFEIQELYFCGLATDYCVFYSALDAVEKGYKVYLIEDACKGVDFPEGNIQKSVAIMKSKGIKMVQHNELL